VEQVVVYHFPAKTFTEVGPLVTQFEGKTEKPS
jgi:hypothetical protein